MLKQTILCVAFAASPLATIGVARAADGDINALVTADNAYRLGWGTANGMRKYFPVVENTLNQDITQCGASGGRRGVEALTIPVSGADAYQSGEYIYLAAYSDKATSQGVLGQFSATLGALTTTLVTGAGPWQVCATGQNYSVPSSTGGPAVFGDPGSINAQIQRCNVSDGALPSGGWVNIGAGLNSLALSGSNGSGPAGGSILNPITCLAGSAKWMWYTPPVLPGGYTDSFHPAAGANPFDEYLIFRIPLNSIGNFGGADIGLACPTCIPPGSIGTVPPFAAPAASPGWLALLALLLMGAGVMSWKRSNRPRGFAL